MGCSASTCRDSQSIAEFKEIIDTLNLFQNVNKSQVYLQQNKYQRDYLQRKKSSILRNVTIGNQTTFEEIIQSIKRNVVDYILATVDIVSEVVMQIAKNIIERTDYSREKQRLVKLLGTLACIEEVFNYINEIVKTTSLNNMMDYFNLKKSILEIKSFNEFTVDIGEKGTKYKFRNTRPIIQQSESSINQNTKKDDTILSYQSTLEDETPSTFYSSFPNDKKEASTPLVPKDGSKHYYGSFEVKQLESSDYIELYSELSSSIKRTVNNNKGTSMEYFLEKVIESMKIMEKQYKKTETIIECNESPKPKRKEKKEKKDKEKEKEKEKNAREVAEIIEMRKEMVIYEEHIVSLNQQVTDSQLKLKEQQIEFDSSMNTLKNQMSQMQDYKTKCETIEQHYLSIQQEDAKRIDELERTVEEMKATIQFQDRRLVEIFKKKYIFLMKTHCPEGFTFELRQQGQIQIEEFTISKQLITETTISLPRVYDSHNDDIDVQMYSITIPQESIDEGVYEDNINGSTYFNNHSLLKLKFINEKPSKVVKEKESKKKKEKKEKKDQSSSSKQTKEISKVEQQSEMKQDEHINGNNNEMKEKPINQLVQVPIPIQCYLQGGTVNCQVNELQFQIPILQGELEGKEYLYSGYGINYLGQKCDLILQTKYEENAQYQRVGNDLVGTFFYDIQYVGQTIEVQYPIQNVLNQQVVLSECENVYEGYGFKNGDSIGNYKVIIKLCDTSK